MTILEERAIERERHFYEWAKENIERKQLPLKVWFNCISYVAKGLAIYDVNTNNKYSSKQKKELTDIIQTL